MILVRTQEAKARLPKEFDSCLAMTILESKGLEFDDVFLWDFFADSRADSEWRVVLNFLRSAAGGNGDGSGAGGETAGDARGPGASGPAGDASGMLRALPFSDREHQILCEGRRLSRAIELN